MVELGAESLKTLGNGSLSKIGATGDNNPSRFAQRVRINNVNRRLEGHEQ
jgi:hypothetical protein